MAAVKTVKESVSGRLSGLKFMQRAKIREEEFKKQEAEEVGSGVVDDSHWVTPAAATSRCKVIVEGDPKPGALIGRMSFQNCNPIVERIVEEVQARRERIRWSHSFFFCGIGVRVFTLVYEFPF
jgi:M-phase phosphoprotein-6